MVHFQLIFICAKNLVSYLLGIPTVDFAFAADKGTSIKNNYSLSNQDRKKLIYFLFASGFRSGNTTARKSSCFEKWHANPRGLLTERRRLKFLPGQKFLKFKYYQTIISELFHIINEKWNSISSCISSIFSSNGLLKK